MTHQNSKASNRQCSQDQKYTTIKQAIAMLFETSGRAFTDREVKDLFFATGVIPHDDMNMVRPKITALIQQGMLVEVGDSFDPLTRRAVRKVAWSKSIS